jgi:hypothetical protein
MYESEKARAKADFVSRFVWNNEDGVILRAANESEAGRCSIVWGTREEPHQCPKAGTFRMFDYEDEHSGGLPICPDHAREWMRELPPTELWVTQEPEAAWTGCGVARGNGWSGLWFLFAPEGTYSREGEWPYEEQEWIGKPPAPGQSGFGQKGA